MKYGGFGGESPAESMILANWSFRLMGKIRQFGLVSFLSAVFMGMQNRGSAMCQENVVLCAASAYEQKFYLNEDFAALPESIKEELQIISVLFTADVGGVLIMEFWPEGDLRLRVDVDEEDILFDDIGSGLKIRQLQRERAELFESLEMYYRVFFMGDTTGLE